MTTQAPTLKARSIHFISRKLFLAAVALLIAAAGITVAAANRFAVVGVENGTQVTIRLQHKWGNGEWRTDVLRPGYKKWFWREDDHANQNSSAPFHVRFDSDLNPGQMFSINYALKKNASPAHEWANAHKYIFRYDGTRNYIDLYEAR